MIENAIDNILTKLAERDYWDIEVLWNRFGIELPILEWLDSEGLIELRTVSIISSRAGDGHVIHSFETPRPNIKPWFSPMKEGMSWLNVFPRNADDMSHRVSWRNANGACPIKKNDVRDSTPFTNLEQVYDAHNHAPRELRVSVGGRKMLAHRVAMSAQRKLQQANDARLHASIGSVDVIRRELIQNQTKSAISNTVTRKRKRKASLIKQARKLTKIELNTLTTVGKHSGNYAAAAKELGKDPSTVRINHSRALAKSGRQNPQSRSVGTKALTINARGQQDI